jgi:hypothetical protein
MLSRRFCLEHWPTVGKSACESPDVRPYGRRQEPFLTINLGQLSELSWIIRLPTHLSSFSLSALLRSKSAITSRILQCRYPACTVAQRRSASSPLLTPLSMKVQIWSSATAKFPGLIRPSYNPTFWTMFARRCRYSKKRLSVRSSVLPESHPTTRRSPWQTIQNIRCAPVSLRGTC